MKSRFRRSLSEDTVGVRKIVHDLSQPVTALMCLLEMAQIQREQGHVTDIVDGALVEASRIVHTVQLLQRALQPTCVPEGGL